MEYEHIAFHYLPLSFLQWGLTWNEERLVTLHKGHILPIINTDEIPENESSQSIVCVQEVIDNNNRHSLFYFDVWIGHVGE